MNVLSRLKPPSVVFLVPHLGLVNPEPAPAYHWGNQGIVSASGCVHVLLPVFVPHLTAVATVYLSLVTTCLA